MKENIGHEISIDSQRCSSCGLCVDVCIEQVFSFVNRYVVVSAKENCHACGHCVSVCKRNAIEHELFPLKECPTFNREDRLGTAEMAMCFRERRSVRNYLSRPVQREVIEEVIAISRWVPSSQNKQQVDWLVFDRPEDISYFSRRTAEVLYEKGKLIQNPVLRSFISMALGKEKFEEANRSSRGFIELYNRVEMGEDPIFYNAPVVLVAYTPSSYFGRDDSIYSLYNVMLAAHEMGLGSCQIGYFIAALDNDLKLRRELGLAKGCIPQVATILGYPRYEFHRVVPRRVPNIEWNIVKNRG